MSGCAQIHCAGVMENPQNRTGVLAERLSADVPDLHSWERAVVSETIQALWTDMLAACLV